MKNLFQKFLILLFIFTFVKSFAQSTSYLVYINDKENVVASAMEGEWFSQQEGYTMIFKSDTTVLKQIPTRFYDFLKDKIIYSVGYITLKSETKIFTENKPYFLTVLHGNPHIFWFREREGNPLGDSESFNVFIAIGETPVDDLLYVGGDFNNQPFFRFTLIK